MGGYQRLAPWPSKTWHFEYNALLDPSRSVQFLSSIIILKVQCVCGGIGGGIRGGIGNGIGGGMCETCKHTHTHARAKRGYGQVVILVHQTLCVLARLSILEDHLQPEADKVIHL